MNGEARRLHALRSTPALIDLLTNARVGAFVHGIRGAPVDRAHHHRHRDSSRNYSAARYYPRKRLRGSVALRESRDAILCAFAVMSPALQKLNQTGLREKDTKSCALSGALV
jgi:hypothetical protein